MQYIGAGVIVVCAYFYGIYFAASLKKQEKMCQTALSVLRYVSSEIERRVPTEKILQRLGERYEELEGKVKNTSSVSEYFKDNLESETGEICSEFFLILGKTNTDLQKNELNYLTGKMQIKCNELGEKTKKDAKICRLVPMFFALLVIIIFI